MLLLGLTKTTLLDYPGKVAATVFTGGCNFRCPFCHNGHLVTSAFAQDTITAESVLDHLTKRRNVLQGVCISGGEPTLQADLPEFISQIKELGYDVKLDTNGSYPNVIKQLIDNKLIDYVAMDVKNSKKKYLETACCSKEHLNNVEMSMEILRTAGLPYEFRTTVVKQFHDTEDLKKIAKWIEWTPCWYIQSYKDSENVIKQGFSAYTKDELDEMVESIKEISNINVLLRGVE